jgi:hypothetical protein
MVVDRRGEGRLRVLASGATELWADGVRQGDRLAGLGETAVEVERPLHLAAVGAAQTLCGVPVDHLREYPVDFSAQEPGVRCPGCDQIVTRSGSG